MRIIGGKYRGRRIDPPQGFKARPTTDFARESLFNILGNRIDFEEARVLDLFAGTGSISYEFSSRGAKEVHLVEQNLKHISGIKRIIRDLGLENIRPIHIEVRTYLKICKAKYDVVFADPPYDLRWLEDIPDMVTGSGILEKDGFLVLEHPKKMDFSGHRLFFEHRNYGGVNFSFFRTEPA
ncbi:MAG: N6-adenine-specific methylase [Bacteroidetes bacterium]|nr:N6-adenine-specific methylase [Bacteroidota bacterium]